MHKWLKSLQYNEGKLFAQDADLNFQNFSTVQMKNQPQPLTLASANTIAPQGFFTILTGNTVVKTITPPLTGVHMLAIQFAGVAGADATGNVTAAFTSVNGQIGLFIFNPLTAKYTAVT